MAVEQVALDGVIANVTGKPEVVKTISISSTGTAQDGLPAGRAAAAASVPTVSSTEDFQTFGPTATARLLSSLASTNANNVKSSQGRLFRVTGYNSNAAARYLKFYNKASAPTVGTDTPIWTEYLAAQTKFSIDMASLNFSTGIAFALTTGSPDNDTGALTAGDVTNLNISYS